MAIMKVYCFAWICSLFALFDLNDSRLQVRTTSVYSASGGCVLFNQVRCFVMFQDTISITDEPSAS